MARIVCQVLHRAERISFLWSEGPASFEPYHLEGAERTALLDLAGQIHASLRDGDARNLAQLGQRLYRALFPDRAAIVQRWLTDQATPGKIDTLEFPSDAPGLIPWNILIEQVPDRGDVWPQFFGSRFRMAAGRRVNILAQNPVQVQPVQVMAADLDLIDQLTEAQRPLLNPQREANSLVHGVSTLADGLKAQAPDVLSLLVRFAKGQLWLGNDGFTLTDLQAWLDEPREGNPDPILLLMACGDPAEQVAWQAFLGSATAHFSGVVANETLMPAAKVFGVGQAIAQRFVEGPKTLGEILQALRQEQGAAALAFSAFCPPEMRVVAELPPAETTASDLPLPRLPYHPFAPYDADDRALFFGREDATLRGALLLDEAATCGVILHGGPAVGKTSYLQAGLLPFLEQDNLGYRVLQDRSPVDTPIAEDEYPALILRATSDLAGQFADALSVFCAQPYTYTTPGGTEVNVDLPKILRAVATGAVSPGATAASTAIQPSESAGAIATAPGEPPSEDADDDFAHELWIALRDNPGLLATVLDAITKSLPFELIIAIDQGEELVTLVESPQQRDRRAKALTMLMGLAGAVARCKIVFVIRTQVLGEFVNLLPGGQAPAAWRAFFLAPLAETDIAFALQLPTSREEIPYSTEIPHQKYGFSFEEGAAQQIVADAMDAAAAEQLSPLAIIQAMGALLYDKQVQGKKQSTVGMNDVRQLGGVKQALSNYLDRSIERLGVSAASRVALGNLIGKLYVSHADGTLSRDVVSASELKNQWIGSQEPVESIVNHAADAEGLFEIQQLMIGGSTGVYVSLPQDSMAQLGKKISSQRDLHAYGRTRMIDTLWIMIPLAFLTAAISYFVTRNYISPAGGDEFSKEKEEKLMEQAREFADKQIKFAYAERTRRPIYYGQLARAELAWRADNALRARQILLEEPASRNFREDNKEGTRLVDLRGFEWKYLWKQLHSERYLFQGHTGTVHEVAISPDNKLAASASDDGTIRIWNLARGEIAALVRVAKAPEYLRTLAISPDGKTLASSGPKNAVYLWDISNLKTDFVEITKEAKTLSGHTGSILTLAFGKDSGTLASAGSDSSIIVWDLTTGEPRHTLKKGTAHIAGLAFAGDGKSLVSINGFGQLTVWDAVQGKSEREIAMPTLKAHRVALSADGKTACTAGAEPDDRTGLLVGTVRFVDLASGKESRPPLRHGRTVTGIAFHPDGKTIATGAQEDLAIRLWNLTTGKEEAKWVGHYGAVTGLAFAPNGTALVSGSYDTTVKVWSPSQSSGPEVIQAHADWVQCLALHGKNGLLASGSRDGTVKLWDPANGKPLLTLPKLGGPVTSLTFSHHKDKTFLAASTRDGKNEGAIQIWQLDGDAKKGYTAVDKHTLKGHTKGVTCLAYYPAPEKADILVSGGADHTVRVWDTAMGKETQEYKGHKDEVRSIAFGPEGRSFVSGGTDGQVCLYMLDRKEITTFPDLHLAGIESLALMPLPVVAEGFRKLEPGLLTGSSDHTMRFWVLETDERGKLAPQLLRHFRSHSQGITSVLFNDKGFGLSASASWDGTIKLFDLDHERFTLQGHTGPVRAIVMAADQSFLASTGNDGTIRFWRAHVDSEPAKVDPKQQRNE